MGDSVNLLLGKPITLGFCQPTPVVLVSLADLDDRLKDRRSDAQVYNYQAGLRVLVEHLVIGQLANAWSLAADEACSITFGTSTGPPPR